MSPQLMTDEIITLGKKILPPNASLWLYGSRARNEAQEDSDWDLLILLDKAKREIGDWNTYCLPFNDLGFTRNQYVSPKLYTRKEWQQIHSASFAQNVEQDKVVLI